MGRTRTLGRLASLFCVICCAVWLWRQVLHQPVDLRRFVTLYLVGLVFAIGARLQALRWVVPTRGGWMLAPLVGRPWRLPRFREVFVRGEDVIAIAFPVPRSRRGPKKVGPRPRPMTTRSPAFLHPEGVGRLARDPA